MSHKHFMLHKPVGAVCQFVPTAKRKKMLLGDFYDFPEGTMAIGRLDADSEGLLLLTTDGMVSHQIRQKSIEKEYYVQLDGEITEEAIEQLKSGVEIGLPGGGKYQTLPCEAKIVTDLSIIPPNQRKERDPRHGPKSWASITVTEGKFRQVRKMTAAVGYPTLRLVRMRIDKYTLGDLKVGEVVSVDL